MTVELAYGKRSGCTPLAVSASISVLDHHLRSGDEFVDFVDLG